MKCRRLRTWKRWRATMPVDALFEAMAGCFARTGIGLGVASDGARLGRRPLHGETQEGGVKPPLQRIRAVGVSTTETWQFVVENRGEKRGLKVLVEAFLLAFCPTCRRADIFHSGAKVPASAAG